VTLSLILALTLAAWILSARREPVPPASARTDNTPVKPPTEPHYAEMLPGKEDFRFLLAILAGVALGVGAVALQKMIQLVAWTPEFALLTLFWVTSFAAVVVVYLAVKYGSVFIDRRIDATETILLMIVTIAECAMFASVALGPSPNLALRWFVSLSTFGLFAGCMVTVVYHQLAPRLHEHIDGKLRYYIESLRVDMAMPFVTWLNSAIYISINPHPSTMSALIAGAVNLLALIAGIIKQRHTRRRIFS
jgi:hypothetical protein